MAKVPTSCIKAGGVVDDCCKFLVTGVPASRLNHWHRSALTGVSCSAIWHSLHQLCRLSHAHASDRLQVAHPIGGDGQALCLAQLTQWVSIQLGVTQPCASGACCRLVIGSLCLTKGAHCAPMCLSLDFIGSFRCHYRRSLPAANLVAYSGVTIIPAWVFSIRKIFCTGFALVFPVVIHLTGCAVGVLVAITNLVIGQVCVFCTGGALVQPRIFGFWSVPH